MRRSALFLLCIAMPATVSAQAPAAPAAIANATQAAATDIVATNWSLGKPKPARVVRRKQGAVAAPSQVQRQSGEARIVGGARTRYGRPTAKVGVKLPL